MLYDPEELPDVPLLPEQADDESDKDEAFDYPDHVVSYHGDQPGRSAHEHVPGRSTVARPKNGTDRATTTTTTGDSNDFIPIDYDKMGNDLRALKWQMEKEGNQRMTFGKWKGFTIAEVADRNWGYVKWCMAQQNPSDHLIWFLRQVERYKTAKRKHDLLESLQWETYKVNSSPHPVEWTPYELGDEIENAKRRKRGEENGWVCPHPSFEMYSNQHGSWWRCTVCNKQINYIAKGKRPRWYVGVVHIAIPPVQQILTLRKTDNPCIIMDSGCRRSVAGKDWHDRMLIWTTRQGLRPVRKFITESFEFGGGEVVDSNHAIIYPVILNGHLVELDVAEVERCPPLLSSQAMKALGMELNYAENKVKIHTCQMEIELIEDRGGHPVLELPKCRNPALNMALSR